MTRWRPVALGGGLLSLLAGFGLALTDGAAVEARPGVVVFLGIVAVGLALYQGYRGSRTPRREWMLDDRSTRRVPDHPDDEVDSDSPNQSEYRTVEELRDLLFRTASRRGGGDTADAERQLADGTWTDDPTAAALFADTLGNSREYRDTLGAWRAGTTRRRYRIDRVAAVVRDRLGIEADDERPKDRRTDPTSGTITTGRWAGFRAIPLAFVGVGILARRPALVFAGAVAVVALAVRATATVPDPQLSITREIDEPDATHGANQTVTLSVRNDGDRTLFDCRISDGVPDMLAVAAGSPQLATALRPGEVATVEYTLRATRGDHSFDPPQVVVTDAAGTTATVSEPAVSGDDTLDVSAPSTALSIPVPAQTTHHRGRIDTDQGGDGIEFYASREYQPGDPLTRIDWNRYASTRELSTLEFREEHAATIVVLVDGRRQARDAPVKPELDSTIDRCVVAARGVLSARLSADDRVGLASIAPSRVFVGPGGGHGHRSRLETVLTNDPAFGPTPTDGTFLFGPTFRWLRRELPASAQVVCCSPLLDDQIVQLLRYLAAYGHDGTVVSPAPATPPTADGTITAVHRQFRISALRREGISVVDWNHGESIASAVDRHEVGR